MNWLSHYSHNLNAGSHLDEYECDTSIENCYEPVENVRPDDEALIHLLGTWIA